MIFLFLALISILLPAQVFASVSIDLETKPQFITGEDISFDYYFLSDKDEQIDYFVNIDCPNAPLPLQELKSILLKKNIPFKEEYVYLRVTDEIEPQICKISISIVEPLLITKEQTFEISANRSFKFQLFSCKEISCIEKSKVFILNDDIYLDYISEVENPEITANLIYPDKTEKQITLPTQIKANQVGNYEFEVVAEKQDYKTINKKAMFAVIAAPMQIKSSSICNIDGECILPETVQNCPQDCVKTDNMDTKLIIIAIIMGIMILAVFNRIRIRNKS